MPVPEEPREERPQVEGVQRKDESDRTQKAPGFDFHMDRKARRRFQYPLPPQALITLFYAGKVCDEITIVVESAQPPTADGTQMPYTEAVIHKVRRFANIPQAYLMQPPQIVCLKITIVPR